ncbi:hypothetical protein [Streptomyces sp. NRRL S-118]|uniref:hypothetical protein n=1 Tax=Streptomyces sp. NRRL S-118 TaxID=1463881 RepID=UPI0004CC7719|nr:hypothetical protein [Streptomyces sp. NRRL S-118]
MPRNPLPPPPPPVHLRTWPDRDALLADRALAVGELTRRLLGGERLTLFLLLLAGLHVGWLIVGGALMSLDDGLVDPLSGLFAVLGACFGAAVMIPAGYAVASSVRRDRAARELLLQWAALDRDPARDARLRAPAPSVTWFLLSFGLCAAGLWLSFTVPAAARPGATTYAEVAYGMGAGLLLWVHGLIGLAKAVGHYRFAVRLLRAPGRPEPA